MVKTIGISLNNYEFSNYMTRILSSREESIIKAKSMELKISKSFADLFTQSNMVSSKVKK